MIGSTQTFLPLVEWKKSQITAMALGRMILNILLCGLIARIYTSCLSCQGGVSPTALCDVRRLRLDHTQVTEA